MNDGLQNEINIVEAYNGKHIEELTKNQKEIVEVIGNFDDDVLIKAEKIKGTFKPDIEFEIENSTSMISVKKGTSNSIHQENVSTFLDYCIEYLDMSDLERDSLLYFLYGDGTLDGTGDISARLSGNEVKKVYAEQIAIVNNFFSNHVYDLAERFLVTGRYGKDNFYKADYLYHGDEVNAVMCPLNNYALEYISKISLSGSKGLVVGPFTVQAMNRNASGKAKHKKRRDDIQVKFGGEFRKLIENINNYYVQKLRDENIDVHQIGNNSHGFDNQNYIVEAINGNQYKRLNDNLRNVIKTIFPNIKNTDVIHANKVRNNKIKPSVCLRVNNEEHYLSVKMGKSNSVHQEKLTDFLDFCYDMPEEAKTVFLKFIYGDGTIDGSGDIKNRCDEETTFNKLRDELPVLQQYLENNKKKLVERFLCKGSYDTGISSEFMYYGTKQNGIVVSMQDIMDYICKYSENKDHLNIGPLAIQTWNRNLKGDVKKDSKRNSIQIKWTSLKKDLTEIALKNLKNTGTNKGTITEYQLVSMLNRFKNKNNDLWREISNILELDDISDIYAVRVTCRVFSKLSEKLVLPKSDIYLIKAKISDIDLKRCNYWLDEDNIQSFDYVFLSDSGISCKNVDSKSFTYTKLTIQSFNKLFKKPELGAAVSLFVTEKDKEFNAEILNRWGFSQEIFKDKIETLFKFDLSDQYIHNMNECREIKRESINYLKKLIISDDDLKQKIFSGKGVYDDPYCANFIYKDGLITTNNIEKFTVTTGSGRHRGNITIVVKP